MGRTLIVFNACAKSSCARASERVVRVARARLMLLKYPIKRSSAATELSHMAPYFL